jgi:TolB-like protein/Tfp pilus assembly protein PilF/tRNA A-37 threonylcarbamoyl transferase component Bud32
MTVTCPKCQAENSETARFCSNCAASLQSPEKIPGSPTETLQTPVKELTTGSTFAGRYQIIEELGKGGMGRVYKVFDTDIKEKVALKLLKPEIASDRETIERFSNELKYARKISHRNVCRMYDLGKSEGTYFITMEYVQGEDLKSMIRMSTGLTVGTVLSVGKQVCEGLAEAHSLGVVHRDLKPQNIMIDKGGNAKIMDFGIARSIREKGITGPSVLIGTPEYMSPEQAEAKEVDHRSDIYSLGIILYEMATGRVPFEGDTALSIAMKHKGEVPKNPKEFNPNIPDDLSGVILKCLEKDKTQRYQTAAEVRSELEKIEKGIPTAERIVPQRKTLTSREITVTFGLKKVLLPIFVLAFLVIAGVVIWQIFPKKEAAPAASVKKSIAVLPFVDLSQAKNNEYLCDGISETLINALTNIEGLWVPARTSAFFFKGKTQDIREIGQKLGVQNVLEGSVQVAGDNLRVTARISNVQDGRQVWSDIYNRKLEGVFAIQDDIAQAIVKALKINLLGEKGAPLVKNYTQSLGAYNFYIQGRYFWEKRTIKDLEKALECFQAAIQEDPNYALAYVGLADTYNVGPNNVGWPVNDAFPKAKAAALKALEIDNTLAEAHTSLAYTKGAYEWDFEGAEEEFHKAIKINPEYPTAHHWYAFLLSWLGRHEEAIAEIKLARTLDPLSARISSNVGNILCFARRYSQALEELKKALDLDPYHQNTNWWISAAYAGLGEYEKSIASQRQALELTGGIEDRNPFIAYVNALAGKRKEATRILNNIIESSKQTYVRSWAIACIFAALGEKDQAFAWLDKAYTERDSDLASLKVRPQFDLVRSDPRFIALLRKIGLEK